MKRANSKGFTLIELLVVIAIISLLVSLLLPSLTRAKELARRVVCASNLRNISLGLSMYANDAEGKYPLQLQEFHGGGLGTYHGYVYGFTTSSSNPLLWQGSSLCVVKNEGYCDPIAYYCPANDGVGSVETAWPGSIPEYTSGDRYWGNYTYFGGDQMALRILSYGMGRFSGEFDAWTPVSPQNVQDPTNWLMAADYHYAWENRVYSGNHNLTGNNVVFHDGHVEWTDRELQAQGRMAQREPSDPNLSSKQWRF